MYRLLILGCNTLREGVVVSFGLFLVALLLFLAASHLVPPDGLAPAVLLALAALAMLFAALVLLSTFLIAVLPGARERLGRCDH